MSEVDVLLLTSSAVSLDCCALHGANNSHVCQGQIRVQNLLVGSLQAAVTFSGWTEREFLHLRLEKFPSSLRGGQPHTTGFAGITANARQPEQVLTGLSLQRWAMQVGELQTKDNRGLERTCRDHQIFFLEKNCPWQLLVSCDLKNPRAFITSMASECPFQTGALLNPLSSMENSARSLAVSVAHKLFS